MLRRHIRAWGRAMTEITWGICTAVGVGGVAAVSLLGGVFPSLVRQLTDDISNPFVFGSYLFEYGLIAVMVIGILIVLTKTVLYVVGSSIVWLCDHPQQLPNACVLL